MHGKILVPSDQSQESETVPPLAKQIKGNFAEKVQSKATTWELEPQRGPPWPLLRYFLFPLS